MTFDHPQVGELRLNREKLAIGGAEGQMLVIYHPDAGTDAAEKLVLLASMHVEPNGVGPEARRPVDRG